VLVVGLEEESAAGSAAALAVDSEVAHSGAAGSAVALAVGWGGALAAGSEES
jgi:hypothetical protein